jgi:hypothetical protein
MREKDPSFDSLERSVVVARLVQEFLESHGYFVRVLGWEFGNKLTISYLERKTAPSDPEEARLR